MTKFFACAMQNQSAYLKPSVLPHVDTARSNAIASDFDLSQLAALRSIHKTEQARKGIRCFGETYEGLETSSVGPSQVVTLSQCGSARAEIACKFYQLLRDADAEGERVGTGLHQTHVWTASNGNSLNAAKAAETRMNVVCALCHNLQF
jgi:hypothetical protein